MRDDLPHAMRETANRLEPDVMRLAAGGVSRGTRMRRVERAVQVLGSVLAVGVVVTGAALFGAHRTAGTSGGGEGEANQSAVSRGEHAESTEGLKASGSPGLTDSPTPTTPAAASRPQITEGELIKALKSGLAGTGVTALSFVAHGSSPAPASALAPTLDLDTTKPTTPDTPTASTILVDARLSTVKNTGFLGLIFSGPQNLVGGPGAPLLRTDGAVVYISQEPGSSDGRHSDRTDLRVTLVRPDGSSISALETNSPTDKSAAAYAGAPLLLTSDQVVTLLDSPVWDAALAAADAQSPPDRAAVPSSASSPFVTPSPS